MPSESVVLAKALIWAGILSALSGSVMAMSLGNTVKWNNIKLVLLDRDGVVNQDVGAPGVTSKDQFELTPDAGVAIGRLKREGYKVVLVTNQSCVGKEIINDQDLHDIHSHMKALLQQQDADGKLDKIYTCTSVDDTDYRKKPNPGMMMEAMADFGMSADQCILIGDNVTDLQAATAAKINLRVLVSSGYGRSIMGNRDARDGVEIIKLEGCPIPSIVGVPFYYVHNLVTAVDFIVKNRTDK